jgi:CheY-like chemotaxis protein
MARLVLLEDSPTDAGLLLEALDQAAPAPPEAVHVVEAEAAMEAVRAGLCGARPDLMILDIGLPGPTGLDVLERIRREAPGADWPMVMLTSSMARRDIERARAAGAAAFYCKPFTLDGYVHLGRILCERFLGARETLKYRPDKS